MATLKLRAALALALTILVLALLCMIALMLRQLSATQWTPAAPARRTVGGGNLDVPVLHSSRRYDAQISGYVFVRKYGDQLSQALANFFQLAYIVSGWNLKVVEPFMRSDISGLVGFPDNHSLTFLEAYSKSSVHEEMEKCIGRGAQEVMKGVQDFLVNAARQFIVVRFDKGEKSLHKPSGVYQCSGSPLPLERELNRYLDHSMWLRTKANLVHGGQYKFKGLHTMCVNGWNFSMEDVHAQIVSTVKSLSFHRPRRKAITVVIPEWRRVSNIVPTRYYYQDTSFTWKGCNTELLSYGDRVVQATEAFMYRLNLHRPILGIHIRIEKLVTSEVEQHFGGRYWQSCLKVFESVVHGLQQKYNIRTNNIVAMHDLTKFGSIWCRQRQLCYDIKDEVHKTLNRLGIKVVYYDPARFNEINSSSFISLVDMAFLTRADYLLTLAWGGYHEKLIQLFQASHGESASFNVCFSGQNHTGHHLPGLDVQLL